MKRDMELIRKILLSVESHEDGFAPRELSIEGYSDDQVGYHCYLLGQAGLAEVVDITTRGSTGPKCVIRNLTWEGHEFLVASRDPTTWEAAKKTLSDAGRDLGNVTLATLQALLIEITKRSIGL
jgi:hypothetical protein